MVIVGFGDDGWTSCINCPELSVADVSARVISGSVISAMAPSTVIASLTLPWKTIVTKVNGLGMLWYAVRWVKIWIALLLRVLIDLIRGKKEL